MDYIVICLWIVIVITGPEMCTHRPSLSFADNEKSHKVVVMEGAAGLSVINQIISIS
jgi:hypothetical protein